MAGVQIFICLLAVCFAFTTAEERKAVATLTSTTGSVSGSITFTQTDNGPVHIVGDITGLSQGYHGFHVHEKGDLSGGCGSTGGHYNPEHKHHGGPQDAERHVGDLGHILANENNVAHIDTTDSEISLTGAHSIIGRAVVVHALPDDMGKGGTDESKKTGSAGARLGCGVIGVH